MVSGRLANTPATGTQKQEQAQRRIDSNPAGQQVLADRQHALHYYRERQRGQ